MLNVQCSLLGESRPPATMTSTFRVERKHARHDGAQHGLRQTSSDPTRTRDNQRRSRARRKEYLESLEVKYRECQRLGVEASMQLQTAARRVVEENKRLRQMLNQLGVTDDQITQTVRDLSSSDIPEQVSPTDGVQAILDARGACDPMSDGLGTTPTQQLVSRLDQSDLTRHTPVEPFAFKDSSASLDQEQTSNVLISIATGNNWDDNIVPENAKAASAPDQSSCFVAADAIRSMNPELGGELEHELGCDAAGSECRVPNVHVFELMDRYSGS